MLVHTLKLININTIVPSIIPGISQNRTTLLKGSL